MAKYFGKTLVSRGLIGLFCIALSGPAFGGERADHSTPACPARKSYLLPTFKKIVAQQRTHAKGALEASACLVGCVDRGANSLSQNIHSLASDFGKVRKIDPRCIKAAMTTDATFSFVKCKKSGSSYRLRKASKPCAAPAYVKGTTEVYEAVMNCLNLSPKGMFPLFNHESRFQANAKSFTGPLCYGQLSGVAIRHINDLNSSSKTPENLRLDHILKKCPQLVSQYGFQKLETFRYKQKNGSKSFDLNRKSRCEIVTNPTSCFVYSALYFQQLADQDQPLVAAAKISIATHSSHFLFFKSKKALERFHKSHPEYTVSIERSLFAHPQQLQKLLATWSYNGGPIIGIMFNKYVSYLQNTIINSQYKSLRQEFAHDDGLSTKTFMIGFYYYIKNHYSDVVPHASERRANEVADYPFRIARDLRKIPNLQGLQCANDKGYYSPDVLEPKILAKVIND